MNFTNKIAEFVRDRFIPEDRGNGHLGWFEVGLIAVGAVGLAIMQFGGAEQVFYDWFADALRRPVGDLYVASPRSHPFYYLLSLTHWVGFCLIGYVLLPALYLKLTGRKLRDFYLGFSGFARHAWTYGLLFLVVILPVVIVSFQPAYQQIYPFYPHAQRSWFDLIAWELLYGVQFFALEFFFRAFLLQGLRPFIGYGAVFFAVIPYCMLHFQKTLSESLGAILAGIALGSLAMKYRSLWGGVCLHWAIAISMDLLSLFQKGKLPQVFWPFE